MPQTGPEKAMQKSVISAAALTRALQPRGSQGTQAIGITDSFLGRGLSMFQDKRIGVL